MTEGRIVDLAVFHAALDEIAADVADRIDHAKAMITAVSGAPAPTPPAGDTAAGRHNWGIPHPVSDEFDYTGAPDPAKWTLPGGGTGCWPGHAGNGRRCAKNVTVGGGMMTLTGEASGDTGWVRQRLPVRYGRWEIRSRSRSTGPGGGPYHVLHLIWPSTERWPQDGEYDFVEYENPDTTTVGGWLHWPAPVVVQERWTAPVRANDWHNYGFEWTPNGLVGYVDGDEVFRFAGPRAGSTAKAQDMPSGYLTIQLDAFQPSGLRPAVFDVAWVRFYPVAGST